MIANTYDIIIIGAGPAGCSTAFHLEAKGLKVLIIEKEIFPRRKICGGGISEQAVSALKRLPGQVYQKFKDQYSHHAIHGVRFVSPANKEITIPQARADSSGGEKGYVCLRSDFDHLLITSLIDAGNIDVITGQSVKDIIREKAGFQVITDEKVFKCRFIVGADGAHSIVRNSLMRKQKIRKFQGIGIAAFFKYNQAQNQNQRFLEFFFIRKYLPGYFWIFPVGDDSFTAGLYLPEKKVRKLKLNLKQEFEFILTSYRHIAPHFSHAEMIEPPRAAALPWGRILKPVSGNSFLLVGDAAGLIEPFTGEGIGAALISGEIAASCITRCFRQKSFSKVALKKYDNHLYKVFGPAMISGSRLSMIFKYPAMVNYIFSMAQKSEKIKNIDIQTIREKGFPQKFANPLMLFQSFYKLVR